VPGFQGLFDRDTFLALATRDDASSRLVIQHPRRRTRRWERHDGPFGALDASMLPERDWTLLVHGVESLVPGGWELLHRFGFVPAARVDDLMVSYAADGGGVGPHDDQYDVFLLQGPGRRRWQLRVGLRWTLLIALLPLLTLLVLSSYPSTGLFLIMSTAPPEISTLSLHDALPIHHHREALQLLEEVRHAS